MMEKMKVMEKKMDSQQQALAAKRFSFQDDSQQQYGGRYNKGRGYSNNRGWNRGSYRGNGRGRGFEEVFRILKTMIRTRIVKEVIPGVETVAVPAAEVPNAMDIPGEI